MRQHASSERGSTTIFLAVMGVALMLMVGLVLDGGRKLGALSEARDLADNAARAGARHIDVDHLRTTGEAVLDEAEASAAAFAYLGGTNGTVVVIGDTITVTVHLQVNTTFLPSMSASATESATAQFGIDGT